MALSTAMKKMFNKNVTAGSTQFCTTDAGSFMSYPPQTSAANILIHRKCQLFIENFNGILIALTVLFRGWFEQRGIIYKFQTSQKIQLKKIL